MCRLVLWLLAVSAGYAGAATIERCCKEKTVGGVSYTLVKEGDTGMYGCWSDCIFERVDTPGSMFCFKQGDLEVVCDNEGSEGEPCGPEECGLTCKAGYSCVEVPRRCVVAVPCLIGDENCLLGCGNWICDNAGQEGETCGLSPVDGTCEKNLTCDYDDPFHYPCPTGKCIKPRKKEGESCGSIGSAPCEEWLSCVHDSNVTDAPGICKNKQEGESCGVSWGHSYGTCDEGLTCVYNPWIVDLPGTCKIPEKKEGESCGYTGSGVCEQGLSCVHDSNITDASGTCGKKQEGESCGSCYCPPKNNEGECDNGLTCVPNRPDVDDKGTCVKN